MTHSNSIEREKLHEQLNRIRLFDLDDDKENTGSAVKDLIGLKESLALLDQLSKITPKNLEKFKKDCNSKKINDDLKIKLINFTELINTLQDSKNLTLEENEKKEILTKIQNTIKKTKNLISDLIKKKIKIVDAIVDPYFHLFKAVNEDDFEKFKKVIAENPNIDLNKPDADGHTLLSLA